MTTMSTVWSKKYDKKFTASNIFSLQDQIINNIIDSLVGNGAVLAQEVAKNFSSSGTQNMSAYECVNFVRGQYFKVLSPEMHSQGLKCLRKAVKDDPEYKEAWGLLGHLLAWGYSLYVPFFQAVDKNGLSEAVTAVENAIRIDKNYARAYATRAELLFYERDWEQMMIYAEKAFELAPQDAYTMGQISYLTVLSGFGCKATQIVKEQFNVDQDACKRLDWGYQRARLAHELDAISSMTFENYGLGHYYYATNQWEKMLQIYEEVPTPKFHWWNFLMGFAHHKIGNKEQARYHLDIAREAIMSITDKPLEKLELRIEVWNMLSKFEDARSILKTYGWQ